MYKEVLVPLDGSQLAATVLEQVVTLARACQARVHLLTVGVPRPGGPEDVEQVHLTRTFQAEAYLQHTRAYLEKCDVQVTTTVCIGEPAREILDLAEHQGIDLIIINSRGGGGAVSPFWGSVAEKVASTSRVPVLIFHAQPGASDSA